MSSRLGTAAAAITAGASVLLGSALLLGETPPLQRTIVYTSAIPAPADTSPTDFEPEPSPVAVADAVFAAQTAVTAGDLAARRRVPEVPWNEHGLARVEITSDAIRFDEERDRYVADLADGRLAILTFDTGIQQTLEETVARYEEPGEAVVVIDPSTGAVLALVDDGADPIGAELSRHATAWAASTFKVVTGAALLEGGHVTPRSEECYTGGGSGFELGDLERRGSDETCVTFTDAMARSANIVFGRLALEHLDVDTLIDVAERFGFNTNVPFEMPVERSVADRPDDDLEFARMAAGFRHTRMTPLHGALIQAAIANDGLMMVPTMVASIEDAEGNEVYRHRPFEWRRVLSPEITRQLVDTMSTTCTTGTARSYFGERDGWPGTVRAWGKTGTLSNRGDDAADTYYLYTWFTGFGATDDGERAAVSGLVANTPTWWIKGGFLASEALLAALR